MRKLLLFVFALLLPVVVDAQSNVVTIDGISYKLSTIKRGNRPLSAEVVRSVDYSGDIVIPEKVVWQNTTYVVTKVDKLSDCEDITSIVLPDCIEEIHAGAFKGCTKLTSVKLPKGIETIDFFSECISLTSFDIPNSVIRIEGGAFRDCKFLSTVRIPESVREIGSSAFEGCVHLKSITLPEGIKEIRSSLFERCSELTSINIPNSVKEIYPSAFEGCIALTTITIPDNVFKIGSDAFKNCLNLKTVYIGSGVKETGITLFENCRNLTDVYCKMVNCPRINESAFEKLSCNRITLHVPSSSVDMYKSMSPWNQFNIVGM